MPDEWSSSVFTRAAPGDWAKWTITVPDATSASHLNGASSETLCDFAVRAGLPGPSLLWSGFIVINDLFYKVLGGNMASTAGWVSADRFQLFDFLSGSGGGGFGVYGVYAGTGAAPLSGVAPFVVGTNTVRYLPLVGNFDLDVILIVDGGKYSGAGGAWSFGDDTHAEAAPSDFATHTNPSPISGGTTVAGVPAYVLKANEATTGHADVTPLEVVQFCPAGSDWTVTVHIGDVDGSPASGLAGTTAAPTSPTTLDGSGNATFVVSAGTAFWYGGSDDVAPAYLAFDYDTMPVDCGGGTGGWYIGLGESREVSAPLGTMIDSSEHNWHGGYVYGTDNGAPYPLPAPGLVAGNLAVQFGPFDEALVTVAGQAGISYEILDWTGPFTIEAWAQVGTVGSGGPIWQAHQTPGTFSLMVDFSVGLTSAYLQRVESAGDLTDWDLTGVIDDLLPHHLVVTFDGTNKKLYVDGNLMTPGTDDAPVTMTRTANICFIGRGFSSSQFQGVLDEVAVYDYALTETRIDAHYALQSSFLSYVAAVLADGPAAYYHLDDTTTYRSSGWGIG